MERLIDDIPGSDEGPFVLGKTVSIADAVIAGLYNLFSVEFLEFLPGDALDGYKRAKKVHEVVMNLPEVVCNIMRNIRLQNFHKFFN